jgi:uncharacterized protein (TIGR03084 family)
MVDVREVLADLEAESASVDAMVGGLPEQEWARPTPSPGWTITHQIAHLAWTDSVTLLAATDPDAFYAKLSDAAEHLDGYVDRGAAEFMGPSAELLARWRDGRAALLAALAAVPADERLPWFGVTMTAPSMATARIMETWAHGLDVAEALGVTRKPTDRLRHVVHLGVRTISHGFSVHGRQVPDEPVRVELAAPDGTLWTYGPEDAENKLSGTALDFCLLVTQRRHRNDLGLVATGPVADAWLDVAQAFAGPPGSGRSPMDGAG